MKTTEQQLEDVDLYINQLVSMLRRPEITSDEEQEGCRLLSKAIIIKAFLTSKGKPNAQDTH